MRIQPGYYWIKTNGSIVPARWDGNQWNHEKGVSTPYKNNSNVLLYSWNNRLRNLFGMILKPMSGGGCPLGCTCTQQSDGSIKVTCT